MESLIGSPLWIICILGLWTIWCFSFVPLMERRERLIRREPTAATKAKFAAYAEQLEKKYQMEDLGSYDMPDDIAEKVEILIEQSEQEIRDRRLKWAMEQALEEHKETFQKLADYDKGLVDEKGNYKDGQTS